MKSYKEFTNEDLKEFLSSNGFIRDSRRGDEPQVLDYDKLAGILGCKQRQARSIVSGDVPLQRAQYNILGLHTGAIRPQLTTCAQTLTVPNCIDDFVSGVIFDFEPGGLIALSERFKESDRPA